LVSLDTPAEEADDLLNLDTPAAGEEELAIDDVAPAAQDDGPKLGGYTRAKSRDEKREIMRQRVAERKAQRGAGADAGADPEEDDADDDADAAVAGEDDVDEAPSHAVEASSSAAADAAPMELVRQLSEGSLTPQLEHMTRRRAAAPKRRRRPKSVRGLQAQTREVVPERQAMTPDMSSAPRIRQLPGGMAMPVFDPSAVELRSTGGASSRGGRRPPRGGMAMPIFDPSKVQLRKAADAPVAAQRAPQPETGGLDFAALRANLKKSDK
jgi:hypothetical protein